MKAVLLECFGAADKAFRTIEFPTPEINDEEILIKVKATSINPIDYKIRSGYLPHLVPAFPAILHGDVSGIVACLGKNVKGFQIGDYVYGCIGGVMGIGGASAEYTKADYRLLSKIPENIDVYDAATIPLAGITAYEAIFQRAPIQPGQKVLIYGGVGGVGHFAVQFAKVLGAEVYATVSSEQQAVIAQKLGADHTINYKKETVADFKARYTNGKGFDFVFDTIGNQNLKNSFEAVRIKGTVVTTVSLDTIDLSPIHEKALAFHTVYMIIPILYNDQTGKTEHGRILHQIGELITQGKVKPLIDEKKFSLNEIAKAHEYAEKARNMGKIVVTING
ncbi:zinc-dependent alcohol dehydrogenase family protein [Siphonobacter sp. SORGH_AS_1065]|uniref:zinc-dependent alcohol dehydrogenase family protein n=1 Tax=Siphonobacter sp. SORGH_AS_1065 TaxID=3041795 RepID=UPI002784B17F|nr:zinc-dependent alcohol dehydrogenase family protein [Siphonobacter sp. SORGH_AS_1065]MDQ1087123.1 NADPH2:quinone reductase [Siphonobacter sp. SORGH_AS_1065]